MNNFLGGTNEWTEVKANFITGCNNDCKYCYSKATMIFYKKKTQETYKEETVR
jgi:DNA repair photolyase